MSALDDARREATTGLGVSRPSDDPVAVAGIMQSSSGLRALEPGQDQGRNPLIDSAFDSVQNLLGDLGARMNQLDVAMSNLESLEAATLANSKILNLTMADYLR